MSRSSEFNIADYYLFDRLDEGLGGNTALLFGDMRYSYAQVAERARAFQSALRVWNVRPEERVYVVLPDNPAFAWSFFGALAHGNVVCLGNPVSPVESLEYVLEYSRATALVTTSAVAEALSETILKSPWLQGVFVVPDTPTGDDVEGPVDVPLALADGVGIGLTEALDVGRAAFHDRVLPATRKDDPCIWLFTSGSTGKPKAAVHTHRDFAFNTEVYAKNTVGYRPGDITVSVPRLFFGYATGTNLMFPFAVGATVGLFSERPLPETLAAAIARYRPTVVTNVPTMMQKLLAWDEADRAKGGDGLDMSCVRFNLSAGEALPPALLARFTARWPLVDVYDGIGSAEMFHIYASNRPGDIKPGSLGRVVDGYEIKVLAEDATGPGAEPLPPGETGVLWVKGDSVALCYVQDRDKSWQTFHGHWCRTGDLFRLDEEGYLWFSGRADSLLKVSGQWIAPLEIEQTLMCHPAVGIAACIGAQRDGLTRIKAFVVLREGASDARGEPLVAELKRWVRSELSPHKAPEWVVLMDELPKNDRGKIDRKALDTREALGENPWR